MIPLKVALLWHQHQPLYRSPRSGRYSLPWVRLHGLKDYYDMAAIAGSFPRLNLTFNLVPSLLAQLDDYVAGRAVDPAIELARRPAAELTEDERLALLELFFSVPYRTLIAPFSRYAALYHKRGQRGFNGDYREALSSFREHDLRDLQVWFHLAWCGPTLRSRPLVRALIRKGESFTEHDKDELLGQLDGFLGEIVPIHRKLAAEGIAEISTSPYYHPILPLLCDLASAREAVPDLPLPDLPFRHPEDAAWQVGAALDDLQSRTGTRPRGMWPSEGSLSQETIGILARAGVAWTASDERVLSASLGRAASPSEIHRPWVLDTGGAGGPAIFFRDQKLSDLIGFTYATWDPAAAARDFLDRLRSAGEQAPGGVVSVILDGENAWEHYPDNGVAFLSALYAGLTESDGIETVTFSRALETGPEPARLPRLRAGSWIGASLATWVGHPEKNRAWSLLAAARQAAAERVGPAPDASPVFATLAAAEGSDWFWWFGDDHASEQDAVFDASFRDLLRAVYETLDLPVPAGIDHPIKRTRVRSWTQPTGPVRPVLDGMVTDYFEWLSAGVCDASAAQGAMHQTAGPIRRVAFGIDAGFLYVRVDPERGDVRGMLAALPGGRLCLEVQAAGREVIRFALDQDRVSHAGSTLAARYAAGKVLEVELPLLAPAAELSVTLESDAGSLQRIPRDGVILIEAAETADWSV